MDEIIVKSIRKHISKKNPAHSWLKRINSLQVVRKYKVATFFFQTN
jgi:hypothetical protein